MKLWDLCFGQHFYKIRKNLAIIGKKNYIKKKKSCNKNGSSEYSP